MHHSIKSMCSPGSVSHFRWFQYQLWYTCLQIVINCLNLTILTCDRGHKLQYMRLIVKITWFIVNTYTGCVDVLSTSFGFFANRKRSVRIKCLLAIAWVTIIVQNISVPTRTVVRSDGVVTFLVTLGAVIWTLINIYGLQKNNTESTLKQMSMLLVAFHQFTITSECNWDRQNLDRTA